MTKHTVFSLSLMICALLAASSVATADPSADADHKAKASDDVAGSNGQDQPTSGDPVGEVGTPTLAASENTLAGDVRLPATSNAPPPSADILFRTWGNIKQLYSNIP